MRCTARQVLPVVCLLALAQRVGADGGFFPQFAGSAESTAYGCYGYSAQGLFGCSSGGESQRFGSQRSGLSIPIYG